MSLDEHARAGMAALEEQDLEKAIEQFTKALEIDDSRPDITNLLGMCHFHRGEVQTSIPLLERSLELAAPYDAPEHQQMKYHWNLGLSTAYRADDRIADARRVLEEAITTWPMQVEARLSLGQLLLESCLLDEGVEVYKQLSELESLDKDRRHAAGALAGAIRAFQESDHEASIFLVGHQESYKEYFDGVAKEQEGWLAEAARMVRGEDGEPKPILAEGARSYAMQRVDLVNPADGEIAGVYSETDLLIVALRGLEPLAHVPIAFPWKGHSFPVWVSSQCPWHWLELKVQFEEPAETPEALVERLDPTIGDWYLSGYNGDFGEREEGRFHYISDPMILRDQRSVAYVIDLGRASYQAIEALMGRMAVLHDHHPIRRMLLGRGRLPA